MAPSNFCSFNMQHKQGFSLPMIPKTECLTWSRTDGDARVKSGDWPKAKAWLKPRKQSIHPLGKAPTRHRPRRAVEEDMSSRKGANHSYREVTVTPKWNNLPCRPTPSNIPFFPSLAREPAMTAKAPSFLKIKPKPMHYPVVQSR